MEGIGIIIAGGWLANCLCSTFLGLEKGQGTIGFLAGLFFGPFGLIYVLGIPVEPSVQAKYELRVNQALARLQTSQSITAQAFGDEATSPTSRRPTAGSRVGPIARMAEES